MENPVNVFEGLNGTTCLHCSPHQAEIASSCDGRNIRVLLVRGASEGLKLLHRILIQSPPAQLPERF